MKNLKQLQKLKLGMFKMKNSPYPQVCVKDYPENAATLAYLENVWNYHTGSEIVSNMPQVMLDAIHIKMSITRKRLAQQGKTNPVINQFFTFPQS
mgnify:CR=1 FL=1